MAAQFVQFGPYFSGGGLVAGAQVYHYLPGTSTLKNAFLDKMQVNTASQPLTADADGIAWAYFEGLYKIVVKDANGSQLYSFDNWGTLGDDASLSILDFGGDPTGSSDSAPALLAAVDEATSRGAGEIIIPSTEEGHNYKFFSGIPTNRLGNNIVFRGVGMPTITKMFSGDWFPCMPAVGGGGTQCKWKDLIIDCQGDTYTGALIRFGTNSASQEMTGCIVMNGADSVLLFEDIGGSACHIHHNWFTLAPTMLSGAVVKRTVTAVDSQAAPRKFDHNLCFGPNTMFANTDGFHGVNFDNIYSNGIQTGDNTLNCVITACRFAVPTGQTLHISGNSVIVTGCTINGQGLTIDAGFLYGKFVGNVMDPSGTFTDNTIKTGADSTPTVEDPRLATGTQVLTLATANLPAAAASRNNRLIIEDNGTGDRNLIVYAGGQRFRIDGGAAF